VITLQIADPSSRQRGRPTETRPQISDSNIPTGSNIWWQVLQGCSIPRLTVSRKVTSTFDTVAKHRLDENFIATMIRYSSIEELLETPFSMLFLSYQKKIIASSCNHFFP
jgi:hypothetical protein